MVVALVLAGLVLGSFVNALVWRLHEQVSEKAKKKPNKTYLARLSISRGRSMCPHCRHELVAKDLVPVLSWLALRGKCRYCGRPIADSPLVELGLAGLFVASYLWWPVTLSGWQIVSFGLWLLLLTGFAALSVYDLRWWLLPNRLIYPLAVVAGLSSLIAIVTAVQPWWALLDTILAVMVSGGVFYLLFQLSRGRWIGGGDVRLGWLLGLLVGTPGRGLLMIFIAALCGSLVSLPLLVSGRLRRTSTVPFGPFLILGALIVQFFGGDILQWYQHTLLLTT